MAGYTPVSSSLSKDKGEIEMKNEYEVRGEVTAIFLNSPKYGAMETIISTKNLEKVKEFGNTWYPKYERKTDSFYAVGNITISLNRRKVVGMHQWVMNQPVGMKVDHINHDTLNNTTGNLRIATNSENLQNRKGATRANASGIRGVTWDEKRERWRSRIIAGGKEVFLGYFTSIEEAEKKAIEARKKYMPFSNEAG